MKASSQLTSIRLITVYSLLLITVLTAIAIVWKRETIEVNLIQRTRFELDQLGFNLAQVYFEGRDGRILIPAAQQVALENEAVRTQLSSIEGVRVLAIKPQSLPVQTLTFNSLPQEHNDHALYSPPHEHPLEQIDLSTIQFHYARMDFTNASRTTLNLLASAIKNHPNLKLEISAHTDNRNTTLGNLAMSQARAQMVVNYLISSGIPSKQLIAVGYGSTRPIATNTTRQGREANQRIALRVLKE